MNSQVRKRSTLRAITWRFAVVLLAAGVATLVLMTLDDRRANRSVRVVASRTANAVDTGEVAVLKRLAAGGQVGAADLRPSIAFVRQRNDGADFRLITLLRARYAFGDRFSPAAEADLRATLLDVPYWMDRDGAGGPMVFWSENHQILFFTDEFLVGGLYPAATFRDGLSGAAHRARARDRILFWLDQRWRFGFSEWNSHYYLEDLAALANLVDFAADREVSVKAAMAMDLIFLDLAGQSTHGEFVAASGRLYENNAKFGDAAIRRVMRHAFVARQDPASAAGIEINVLMSGYQPPAVLRAIASDPGVAVVRASTGRRLEELDSDPALAGDERRIMALWGMEAITNPQAIDASARYIRSHGLLSNPHLAGFRALNYRMLTATGALPVVSRALDLPTNGVVLDRADTYAYRTADYVMSTTQAYRPGGFGNQHRVFVLTFDPGVTLFHGQPATLPGEPPPNGNSPGYWTGSGRLPLSCQDGPVNLSLYRLPRSAGLGRRPLLAFTHLYAPLGRFDRVLLQPRRLFLRHRGALVAVTAAVPLTQAGDAEFIQRGRDTFWVTEASSTREESFDAFVARISRTEARLDGGVLTYRSRGHVYGAAFGRGCAIDGEPMQTAYPRYQAPWGEAPRDPKTYSLAFGGHSLHLDFNGLRREAR